MTIFHHAHNRKMRARAMTYWIFGSIVFHNLAIEHKSNLFLIQHQCSIAVTTGIEMRPCVNQNLKGDIYFLLFSEITTSKYLISRQIHISSGTSGTSCQEARSVLYTGAVALNVLTAFFVHDAHGNTGFPSQVGPSLIFPCPLKRTSSSHMKRNRYFFKWSNQAKYPHTTFP